MPRPDELRRSGDFLARPQGGDSLARKGASPYATDPKAIDRLLSRPERDVLFLLDVSGSMSGEPSKEMVAGVRAAVRRLTGQGAKITLIAFSDDAQTLLSRSRSPERINESLAELPPGIGTAMHLGFLEARRALRDSEEALIHLITDGMPNDRESTLVQAELCREAGIAVRCTGTTGADLDFLRLLAGGEEKRHAELVSTGGLRQAIEATAAALPAPARKD